MPIPVYAGKKFEATHTETFVHEFNCKKCGFSCDAGARARGYAQAHSPFGLDNDSAMRQASEDAWAASARNARSTLRFVTCPKCGYKNRTGLMLFLLQTFIVLFLAAGILFVFAGYFWSEREKGYALLFGAGGIVMMIGLYWAYFHPKWAKADKRVMFSQDTGKSKG
jgi:hypothetical protein